MVRLFRGDRGRGMLRGRHSGLMPRHVRPEPDFLPPYGIQRGRLPRGRPGPRPYLPPPVMGPPPPPLLPPPPPRGPSLPPHPPLHLPPRDMPLPLPPRNRPLLPPPRGRLLPLPPPDRPMMMPLRPRERLPLPPGERHIPVPLPLPLPHRRLPMPPPLHPMPPGPPVRRSVRMLGLRGRPRGGLVHRGVKRLGTTAANGKAKKAQKRKEKSEEQELNKPWVTEVLKEEIKKKHQLFKVAQEKKGEGDWQAYKDQKVLVGKMTNIAKIEYVGSHPEADVEQIMSGATAKA